MTAACIARVPALWVSDGRIWRHLAAPRRISLNAFLIRGDTAPWAAVSPVDLRNHDVTSADDGGFEEFSPEGQDDGDEAPAGAIVVALTDHPVAPPPWQLLLRDDRGVPDFGGPNRVQGAIIFCRCRDGSAGDTRWVAFTFGAGSQAVRRAAVTPRFGRITALNRIARGSAANRTGPALLCRRHTAHSAHTFKPVITPCETLRSTARSPLFLRAAVNGAATDGVLVGGRSDIGPSGGSRVVQGTPVMSYVVEKRSGGSDAQVIRAAGAGGRLQATRDHLEQRVNRD